MSLLEHYRERTKILKLLNQQSRSVYNWVEKTVQGGNGLLTVLYLSRMRKLLQRLELSQSRLQNDRRDFDKYVKLLLEKFNKYFPDTRKDSLATVFHALTERHTSLLKMKSRIASEEAEIVEQKKWLSMRKDSLDMEQLSSLIEQRISKHDRREW